MEELSQAKRVQLQHQEATKVDKAELSAALGEVHRLSADLDLAVQAATASRAEVSAMEQVTGGALGAEWGEEWGGEWGLGVAGAWG